MGQATQALPPDVAWRAFGGGRVQHNVRASQPATGPTGHLQSSVLAGHTNTDTHPPPRQLLMLSRFARAPPRSLPDPA